MRFPPSANSPSSIRVARNPLGHAQPRETLVADHLEPGLAAYDLSSSTADALGSVTCG